MLSRRQLRLGFLLLLSILAGATAARGQSGDSGSVSGHVYCADTQKPARFASVHLRMAAPGSLTSGRRFGQGTSFATTGADGSFSVSNLEPGDYLVDASLPGYLRPLRGLDGDDISQMSQAEQDRLRASLTRITVLPNQTVAATVTIYRGGVLSGVISFDDGSPAPGVPVMAQSADPDASTGAQNSDTDSRHLAYSAQTDDRGEFRVVGVPSGVYTLKAWPRSDFPTFLGNTVATSHAKKIALKQAEERTGLDIQIPVVGLHHVSGSVVAQRDGRVVAHAPVALRLADENGGPQVSTVTAADGSFNFATVPDGKYAVEVNGAYDPTTGARFGPATVTADVSGSDMADVVVSVPSVTN
jgi:hypothetical protein